MTKPVNPKEPANQTIAYAIDVYEEHGHQATSETNRLNRVRSIREALWPFDDVLVAKSAGQKLAERLVSLPQRKVANTGEVISPCTAKNDLRHVRDFFKWCGDSGFCTVDVAIRELLDRLISETERECRKAKEAIATPQDIQRLGQHANRQQAALLLLILNCGLSVNQAMALDPWTTALMGKTPSLEIQVSGEQGGILLWKPTVDALRLLLIDSIMGNKKLNNRLTKTFGIASCTEQDIIEVARHHYRASQFTDQTMSKTQASTYALVHDLGKPEAIRLKFYNCLVESLHPGELRKKQSAAILQHELARMTTATRRSSGLKIFSYWDAKQPSEHWKHLRDRAGVDRHVTLGVMRRTVLLTLPSEDASTLKRATSKSDVTPASLARLNSSLTDLYDRWQSCLPDVSVKWSPWVDLRA